MGRMLASLPGWLLEFLHTIYLSLGSHNKIAIDLWLKQQKFLPVLEVGKSTVKVPADYVPGEGPFPVLYPHTAERESDLC